LNAPTISNVVTSPSTNGAIVITYSGNNSVPIGQTYTALACNDTAMSAGCYTSPNYISGTDFPGLTAGAGYYVEIIANGSPGYLSATSNMFPASNMPPVDAKGSSDAPTVSGVFPSATTAGALKVTYNVSSNASNGTIYSAQACLDQNMTSGCVNVDPFTSGGQVTGLTQNVPYYVTVTADAINGILATPSAVYAPVTATVQPSAPTASATSSPTGSLNVTYTPSSPEPSGEVYTEQVCSDSAMTLNCTPTQSAGSPVGGLTVGSSYYVQVVAVASTGYLSAISTPAFGPTKITVQLNPPTGVTVQPGGPSGSVKVNFTGSTNATSYNCTVYSNSNLSNASQVASGPCLPGNGNNGTPFSTGLASNTTVWVTATASGNNGYLTSAPSVAGSGTVK
jgi:hypothetical protein